MLQPTIHKDSPQASSSVQVMGLPQSEKAG
jgi:hypothetical protein